MVYKFAYIPSGLFNRIQVRLFNYADTSTIWKNGSLLKKNSHLALINQSKTPDITVRVQGSKPQNIIFLIHEVIDTLIAEYFHGIKYDYSFPCPECVDAQASDPCLFSASLLRRASELKAPYLQCHKYFHAISIQVSVIKYLSIHYSIIQIMLNSDTLFGFLNLLVFYIIEKPLFLIQIYLLMSQLNPGNALNDAN